MLIPKLRFKEFTDEWEETKINDIAFLTSSKRIYLSDYTNNGIPFYRGKEISELKKGKKVSDLLYIDEMKYNDIKEKYGIPKENDILITAVGTLANIYRIPNNEKFYFKDGNLIWFKNIKCDSKFLEYLLEYNKKLLLDSCIGSTQKALTIVGINKIIMNFPNVNEQTKISKVIQLIDKKIELQTKKIEVLKLYKKGLSKIIFSNNVNDTVKLKDISNIYKGKQINKENMMDFGPYYVLNGGINISGYTDSYNENENTISISEGGNSCGYVNFNKVKYWSGGHCYSINPKEKVILNNYLFQLLKYNEPRIMDLRIGSGLPNIQKKSLENYSVNIHILSYQYIIGKQLTNFDNKIEFESYKLNKLERLKKGLMQNMFV